MRTSDTDLDLCVNKIVEFLMNKDTWITLTRMQLSKLLSIPTGYQMNKIVDTLRYHPHVAFKYGHLDPEVKSCGHVPLLYRYVSSESEKYKLSMTQESVTFMTPKQYFWYNPTMIKLFPDKKDRMMAFRFLDLLYCQHYDQEWMTIDLQRFAVNLAATPRSKMREFIRKFTAANILLVSPDYSYRLASINKKENKKNMLDQMRKMSEQIPKMEDVDPGNLEFRYLNGLNDITKEVSKLQEFNTNVTKSLSDIVLALNQLQKTDVVIRNSDITFVRLNDMYQKLREDYKYHIQAEQKLLCFVNELENEPLTGKSMRIFSEIKRILNDVTKGHDNEC